MCLFSAPYSASREGVKRLEGFYSFVLAVLAGVVSYYICKWLDSLTGGK